MNGSRKFVVKEHTTCSLLHVKFPWLVKAVDATEMDGMETVQVTLLRRTLASSP